MLKHEIVFHAYTELKKYLKWLKQRLLWVRNVVLDFYKSVAAQTKF